LDVRIALGTEHGPSLSAGGTTVRIDLDILPAAAGLGLGFVHYTKIPSQPLVLMESFFPKSIATRHHPVHYVANFESNINTKC
jgi:hypothetical protein